MANPTLADATVETRFAHDHPWRVPIVVLAVGTIILAALFQTEAAAAFGIWRDSTAFGHCFLVGPIVAWLVWERRDRLMARTPRAAPVLAALALPLAVAWLAAERLGVMEWRQFVALFAVWLLVGAVLGFSVARVLAVPLSYSVFLVPFGAFLVPALQDFTARFIDLGLAILDIPHVVTDTLIEIPEGNFKVAEACAGLRFLIAAIAFGALYACILYRGAGRRLAFVAICIVVPVLANGVRALGIVVLGHIRGSAEAGAIDHVVYGWLFFSVLLLLLLLLGLPFRQDSLPPAARRGVAASPQADGRAMLTGAAVLLLTASGPGAATWLAHRAAGDAAVFSAVAEQLAADLVTPAGCVADAATTGPGRRRYICGDASLEAVVSVMDQRSGPAVLAAWRRATDPPLVEQDDQGPAISWQDAPGAIWRLVETRQPPQTLAAALWLGRTPARDDGKLRVQMALRSLWRSRGAMATLVAAASSGAAGPKAIADFIAAQRIGTACLAGTCGQPPG